MKNILIILCLLTSVIQAQEKEYLVEKSFEISSIYLKVPGMENFNKVDVPVSRLKFYATTGPTFFVMIDGVKNFISTGELKNELDYKGKSGFPIYLYDYCWFQNENKGGCMVSYDKLSNSYTFVLFNSTLKFYLK